MGRTESPAESERGGNLVVHAHHRLLQRLLVEKGPLYRRTSLILDPPDGKGDEHDVVERFTRVDANTIAYRVTVTNPAVWTGPWTAAIPMNAVEQTLFEYACHEGNYGVPNILSGNRAEEAEVAGSRQHHWAPSLSQAQGQSNERPFHLMSP